MKCYDIMVLALPLCVRMPVDPDDVSTLTQKNIQHIFLKFDMRVDTLLR